MGGPAAENQGSAALDRVSCRSVLISGVGLDLRGLRPYGVHASGAYCRRDATGSERYVRTLIHAPRRLTNLAQDAQRLIQHLVFDDSMFHTRPATIPPVELNYDRAIRLRARCEFSLEQARKPTFVCGHD